MIIRIDHVVRELDVTDLVANAQIKIKYRMGTFSITVAVEPVRRRANF